MKPPIPWSHSEGYSERDKDWLKVIETNNNSLRRRLSFRLGIVVGFFILMFITALFSQHRTVVIETGDSSTILEIYQDHTFTEHFYIFDSNGAMTEVWVFDEEWVVIGPPPEASLTIPLLFQKDFLGHSSPPGSPEDSYSASSLTEVLEAYSLDTSLGFPREYLHDFLLNNSRDYLLDYMLDQDTLGHLFDHDTLGYLFEFRDLMEDLRNE